MKFNLRTRSLVEKGRKKHTTPKRGNPSRRPLIERQILSAINKRVKAIERERRVEKALNVPTRRSRSVRSKLLQIKGKSRNNLRSLSQAELRTLYKEKII